MADEQDTREVLFPQWMGPDKHGLTIEQKKQGEIFVKEVKEEFPSAHTGEVHKGDQIVGATIYFDNMSSEETAELLKTLNQHKVGLKLQNKSGDKSPCRSPMGTLSWEGRGGLGVSSPDILLSGDDEDYKRIYSKKIKPRLKSEDLAEGVDVRTERHSSTSSDGCTITTITRRITTYTMDMPEGTGQQIDYSSPEFKIQPEQSEGDPAQIRLPHGSLISSAHGDIKMGDISLGGPHATGFYVKHFSTGSTSELDSSEREIGMNVSDTGPSERKEQGVIEHSGRTRTATGSDCLSSKLTMGLDRGVGYTSVSPVKIDARLKDSNMIGETEFATVQGPVLDTRVSGFSISGCTEDSNISGISRESLSAVLKDGSEASGSVVDNLESRSGFKRPHAKVPTFGMKEYTLEESNLSVNFKNKNLKGVGQSGLDITGNQDVSVPKIKVLLESESAGIKGSYMDTESQGGRIEMPKIKLPTFELRGQQVQGADIEVNCPKANVEITPQYMDIKGPEINIDGPEQEVKGSKFKVPSISGPKILMSNVDMNLKGKKLKGDVDVSVPKVEAGITAPEIENKSQDIEGPVDAFKMPKIKMPSFGIKGPKVEGPEVDLKISKADVEMKAQDIKAPELDIDGPEGKIKSPKFKMPSISGPKISMPDVDFNLKGQKLKGDVDVSAPKIEGDIKAPRVVIEGPDLEGPEVGFKMPKMKMPSFGLKGPKVEGPDVDVKMPKTDFDVNIKGPELDIEGPEGKIKGHRYKMPSISGPKISMPDMDFNLKGSKLKGDVDVSVPKIEGDVKAPRVVIEGPDLEGPEGGFKMPKMKMPSFGCKGPNVDVKMPTTDLDVKAPDMNIKGPELDIEGPDGKIKGPRYKMPSISGPKISMPDMDFNLKGQKLKADVDVSVTKMEGDIKVPKVEIEGPYLEGPEGDFKMTKMKMPSFGLKGSKVEGSDVDVKMPKTDFDVKTPDVNIKGPELDIEGPEGKIKGPKFKMPSISGPKISMPDVDFNLKGPKLKGDVDVSVPKIEGDIKAPKVEIEGPDLEGPQGGFKMPKMKMPSFGFKGPNVECPDVDMKMPKTDVDVKAPDVNIKGPELDIEGPEGKIKDPKFKMPSISGPKISMPDMDFNLKGPKLKGDVDVSVPKIEGDVKAPRFEIEGPDLEGPEGGFKMPNMKMPSFGLRSPKVEGPDVDVKIPKTDFDVKTPDVNIKGPDLDIEGPEGKIKGPKFKMPSFSGPSISMPDVDFNLKGPKLKGDVDVSVPKIEGDFKAPKVEIEGPDLECPQGGFKMPKMKMPSFGFKGPNVECPDVDMKMPKTDVDVKAPDVNIKGPELDIEGPEGKIKGPKFKMPSITGPKISMPDVDFNLKGPKLKGDVDVSVPKIEGDIKAPKVEIEGPDLEGPQGGFKMPKMKMPSFGFKGPNVECPDVDMKMPKTDVDVKAPDVNIKGPELDIEGPEGKIKGPKFKMPSISGPKISMPDMDFNLKGPKLKGDVDVSVPKIEGDVKAPRFEIEGPDLEGPEGGFKMPKMKMPSFGLRSPKVEGPDVDVKIPKTDFDVKTPDVNIKGPDLDIEGPEGKIKGPKFKMPSFSGPSISMPDVDFNLKGPKLKGDVDVSVPKIEGDFKAPKVEIEGPDLEGPQGGFKMPKMKMPSFGIKGPNVECPDVDMKMPKTDVDVKAPDVNIKGPELDIEGPEGKIKGPKFKMPSISGPKISMPDMDFNLKGPKLKGDVDVSVPKIEGDIKAPKVEIECPDLEGPQGGFKMPKMKMPSVGFKGPKVEGPDVDVKMPKADVKLPDMNIKGPELDIEGPEGKIKGSEFKMPSISGPNVSLPDLDINLKGPKLKGDVHPDFEGVDIEDYKMNIECPNAELDVPEASVKKSKFKMPKFGFKGSKIEAPDFDVKLPKRSIKGNVQSPDVDVSAPNIKAKGSKFKMASIAGPEFPLPDVDLNLKGKKMKSQAGVSMEGDINVPKLDVEGKSPEGGFKMPTFKMPKFGFKSLKRNMPSIDLSVPGSDVSINSPDIEVNSSDLDIEGPEEKLKSPKHKMPSLSGPNISMPDVDFNLKSPKFKSDKDVSGLKFEGDIETPKVGIEGPDVNIEGPEDGFKMPKFKIPSFGLKGPKVEGPDIDVNLPKADVDIKGHEFDINMPDIDIERPEGKIKGPKFKMPSISGPKISMPDVDFNQKGPKIKSDLDVSGLNIAGDIKAPKVDIEGPEFNIEGTEGSLKMPKMKMPSFGVKGHKLEGPDIDANLPKTDVDIKGPEFDIRMPGLDIERPEGKIKGPKFKMPSISGPNISMPDVNLNLKGSKVKRDMDFSVPKIEGEIKAPKVDIEGPDVNIEGPEGGFKMPEIKMPSFGLKGPRVEGPDIDLNLPKADVDIKTPDLNIEGPEGKIKDPKFKMPSISGPKISMPDIDFNLKSPKIKGDMDVSGLKIAGDIKAPKVDIEGPDFNIEGPEAGLKMPKITTPSFVLKGPKVEGPEVDLNMPKADVDIKGTKIDIKTSDLDIERPEGNLKPVKFPKFKSPSFGIKPSGGSLSIPEKDMEGTFNVKSPDVSTNVPETNVKVQKTKKSSFTFGGKSPKLAVDIPDASSSLDGDVSIDVKGKNSKFKLAELKGKSKTFDFDMKTENVKLQTNEPDLRFKSTKVKKHPFGKLYFPDLELDMKSPKVKGSSSVSGTIKSSNVDLPSASLKTDIHRVDILTPATSLESPDIRAKGGKFKMPKFSISRSKSKTSDLEVSSALLDTPEKGVNLSAPDISVVGSSINGKGSTKIDEERTQDVEFTMPSVHGGALDADLRSDESVSGVMEYQEGNVTFPKIKVPKFGDALPKVEEKELRVNVGSGKLDASGKASSQSLEMHKIDVKNSAGKVKVKMPNLFGKSKLECGSEADLAVQGEDTDVTTKGCAKVSKELSLSYGELTSGKMEVQGSSGLKVSPKSKSASLDFFQKSRHHSSSMRDGGLVSPVSTEGNLQAEGGNISADVGETKVKAKKGKMNFGGFGSKSKGSYEVTLGEESETRIAGAGGVVQPSKKSRMASSSSSDSVSKGSFRFPKLEIAVSPKK
ncbi:neuroblast differentiation-associated protein AHNAK-like [Xyrauchen texanus]|uniref:neuroblast differentiation-associated protein AHNAK-like n=1 Tax=Xyrauchen texanus TaxID=154827 RepID=UPI002241C487|nr:neuroblast differentiation-associated protein AHNAK-like [Xyrauchen texanus]